MTYYQKGSCAHLIKTQNGLTNFLFERKTQYSNFLFLHFTFVFHLQRWCRIYMEGNHCCSYEIESQLTTVHDGYVLAHNRGRNINVLLNITNLKCLVPFQSKYNRKLKMVLSRTMNILHGIVVLQSSVLGTAVWATILRGHFGDKTLSLESSLLRKLLKK